MRKSQHHPILFSIDADRIVGIAKQAAYANNKDG